MSTSKKVHDRSLLDALEKSPVKSFTGAAWRTTWKQREPLVGSSGGGRWDPPNSFEVLYASTEPNGSLAEIYYHLSQAPIFSSCEMLLHRLTVNIDRVLTLNNELLMQLGVGEPLASRLDYSQTQAISSAARFLEFQGIIVPSVRWSCLNLVIFLDRVDLNQAVIVEDCQKVNWPAWKEKQLKAENN